MQNLPGPAEDPLGNGEKQVVEIKRTPVQLVPQGAYDNPRGPNGYDGEEDDLALTIQHYFRIFVKFKWLILGIALFITVMGGLYGVAKTPLYVSTATIQINFEAMKVVDGGAITSEPGAKPGADFQSTHFELLKSRAMAERVVSALQLHNDAKFLTPPGKSLIGWILSGFSSGKDLDEATLASKQSAAISIVLKNMSVQPVGKSRLVKLSYSDPDPRRAQLIANAYADAYVAANLDKRFEANSYAKLFLEDQIKQLKLRLEESEKSLIEFAEREKIVQATDRASIAENNLSAANVALGQLISERIKNEQAWRQVESAKAINLPQLLSNSAIEDLRKQGKVLKREYDEKLETFKPSYPAMVEIANKIKKVERQLASEVATVKDSLKAAYEFSRNQEKEMRIQINNLRTEVLKLQKKGIQYNILKREVETNRSLHNSLLQRYKEVDVAGGVGTNNIFIIDRALAAKTPSEPRMARILILALMLGIGAGLGIAYVLELFDDVMRRPEEIEEASGLPIIGVIPLLGAEQEFDVVAKNPRSAISEAYRSLGTALQFSTETGLPRSIVITSSGASEGKSSTALAIAKHFAMMNMKVLLVDGDLRKPSLHLRLGKDNSVGLSNFLTGAATLPGLVQQTDVRNLKFIASGPLPPNAGDLLGGTRIYSLISVGHEIFDLIIIDSPPMLGLADAQLLASATEATMFVVSAQQSRKGAVQSALRRLRLARIAPIGVVLTKFDNEAAGYGYGYGSNDYSYGNTNEAIDVGPQKPNIAAYGAN